MLKKKDRACVELMQNNGHQVLVGVGNLVPLLIQSLIIFGQRTDLEQLLEEETISNFVIECLENLHLASAFEQFKDIYFRALPSLILDVGMNLIKCTETERMTMLNDPPDFVALALDTCDKQESMTVKTQAAKLFEGLCDNIDGAVTYTTYFCCHAINLTLSKERNKEMLEITDFSASIEQAHRVLVEGSTFVKNSKPDVVIESSILVLGALSYVHSKPAYRNIFSWTEKLFHYYIDDIIGNESVLVRARYCLFLGYLIDAFYKQQPQAFKQTIRFLYSSVNLQGQEEAIALQAIDTLKTVICDQDLIPRLVQMDIVGDLVQAIVASVGTIQNHQYIEFVRDFIKTYSEILEDRSCHIAQAIVQRVRMELQKQSAAKDDQMFVQMCMNVLKIITQNKFIMPKYVSQLEQILMPVYELMVDPTKITFEDDILILLKNFMRRTCSVSDIVLKVLPCLEAVFMKNKQCFGEVLMETLNTYLIYGSERIAQDPKALEMLVRIGDQAMFTTESSITFNNSEGAIFLQILFQIYKGTDAMNIYFENILRRVLERMDSKTGPVKQVLNKHLMSVFLSAFIYNASATIKFLEMNGISKRIIGGILGHKKIYRSLYEQKQFIVGLTSILVAHDAPETIRDPSTVSRLMVELLAMLEKVQKTEAKIEKKKAKKQIQQDDSRDSESSDGSYDDEEDADDHVDFKKENGKRSRTNSNHSINAEEMTNEEESKVGGDAGGLGFTGEATVPNDANPDEDEESSDDDYDNMVSGTAY